MNSEEAVVESSNRQMDLRRGFTQATQQDDPTLKKLNAITTRINKPALQVLIYHENF